MTVAALVAVPSTGLKHTSHRKVNDSGPFVMSRLQTSLRRAIDVVRDIEPHLSILFAS